jgi:hypothetical protein
MNAITGESNCTAAACGEMGEVLLAEQPFCLAHFFERCYERLERLDPLVRGKSLETTGIGAAVEVIGECVTQALVVSLQHEHLSNLERSRLLDILLWSGELQFLLRVPRSVFADGVVYGGNRRHFVATTNS